VVKSTGYSFGGPEFNSQLTVAPMSVTPVPGDPTPGSGLYAHGAQIYIQANTDIHKIKINKI